MSFTRRFTAPISIVLLIIVVVVAPFTILKSNPVISPPVLDPNFELWMRDSGRTHLVVWRSEYVTARGDSISLNRTAFDHMTALKFDLMKQNKSGSTYAFVTQIIDGPRLAALFTLNISVWILRESSPSAGSEVFGIELNDGTHVLTYFFSTPPMETLVRWDERLVLIQTPRDQWVKVPLDIANQFYNAQWKRPERVTLGIIFGAGSDLTGSRRAYLHNFTWSEQPRAHDDYSTVPPLGQLKHGNEPQLSFVTQQTSRSSVIENWSKDLTIDRGDKAARCR